MELLQKFQYTLVLFMISAMIFATGVLPYGGRLVHRYVVAPELYEEVSGEVVEITKKTTMTTQTLYEVTVAFSTEEGDFVGILESPVEGREVGMEIMVIYSHENPQVLLQNWYEWRQFLVFFGFSVMGFFTGLLMMNPASPEQRQRKRKGRSLRERLEEY